MVEKGKKDEGKIAGRDYPDWYLPPEKFAEKYPLESGQAVEQPRLNIPMQPGLFNGNGLSYKDKLLEKYTPAKASRIYLRCIQKGISRERLTSSGQERYDLGKLISEEVQEYKKEIWALDEKPFWIPEFQPRRRKKEKLESKVDSPEDSGSRDFSPEISESKIGKYEGSAYFLPTIRDELLSGREVKIIPHFGSKQYQDRGQSFEIPVSYSVNGFAQFYSCVLKGFDRDAQDSEIEQDSLDTLKRILDLQELNMTFEKDERAYIFRIKKS